MQSRLGWKKKTQRRLLWKYRISSIKSLKGVFFYVKSYISFWDTLCVVEPFSIVHCLFTRFLVIFFTLFCIFLLQGIRIRAWRLRDLKTMFHMWEKVQTRSLHYFGKGRGCFYLYYNCQVPSSNHIKNVLISFFFGRFGEQVTWDGAPWVHILMCPHYANVHHWWLYITVYYILVILKFTFGITIR